MLVGEDCVARLPPVQFNGEPVNRSADLACVSGLPGWGQYQVDQRTPYSATVPITPLSPGNGVTAWIIDTGILISHQEFAGRAQWAYNCADGTNNDLNGHGTHVAGSIGGACAGVTPQATVVAVKVLDASGSGSYSCVISGIDYVAANKRPGPNLINMSLGGGKSLPVNNAVNNAARAGVPNFIAAGNSAADAINYSPASAENAITIGSVTYSAGSLTLSSFSNYGSILSGLSPGQDIYSAWITSDTSYRSLSGTSMATPLALGCGAAYAGRYPTNVDTGDLSGTTTFKNQIRSCGTSGLVRNVPPATPNVLIYDRWC